MTRYFQITLLLLTTACFHSFAWSAQSLDRIVATVNDAVITQSEVDQGMDALKKQMQMTNTPVPSTSALRKQVLDQLIGRKLQIQVAEQAGVHITEQQVNQAINHIAQGNHFTLAELYQKVAEQGMTREDYRKEIREQMELQQIQQQEIGSKVSMTAADVQAFMHAKGWQMSVPPAEKEYQLTDILIPLSEHASPKTIAVAKQRAQEVFNRLQKGLRYATAVPTAEENDLGWRTLQEIPSVFASHVTQLKRGDTLSPIQAANGFHILHLVNVRQVQTQPAPNAQPAPTEEQAKQIVYQRKYEAAVQKWVTKLRGQAVINLHPEN